MDDWGCADLKLAKSAQPLESSSSAGWVVVVAAGALPDEVSQKAVQLPSDADAAVDDETPTANMSVLVAVTAADSHGIGSEAIGATSIVTPSNFAQSENHPSLIVTETFKPKKEGGRSLFTHLIIYTCRRITTD